MSKTVTRSSLKMRKGTIETRSRNHGLQGRNYRANLSEAEIHKINSLYHVEGLNFVRIAKMHKRGVTTIERYVFHTTAIWLAWADKMLSEGKVL